MHYYQFNIGDYYSHTQHLDEIEDLAYRRMLDWIYLHESPLPNNVQQIARIIRMRSHSESIAYVLNEFFTETEYGFTQKKAQEQIDKYKLKSEKAKASANARWAKKPVKSNANALRIECEGNANHKPITNNHNKDMCENFSHDEVVNGFDFFWKQWLKIKKEVNGSTGVKKDAKAIWVKLFDLNYRNKNTIGQYKAKVNNITQYSKTCLTKQFAGGHNHYINMHCKKFITQWSEQ
jgi:uncharacterized protein YdaU (DUF1376 family)